MKKVLVCALAVFFLMASCSTAFATASVTTTTTYANGDTTKMTVTTTVEGAAEGKMYTFLVTDGVKNSDTTNVVAANQKTISVSGTVEFEYTGDATDFVNLNAYSGNDELGVLDDAGGLTRKVGVTFVGADTVMENVTLILPKSTENAVVPFNVDIPYTKKITSVKCGELDLGYANGCINNNFTDGDTLTVTLEDATANIVDTDSHFGRIFWRMNGNEVLTVFAKITSLIPNTEFGIELSIDEGEWVKYKSNGAGSDGSFAVQLINKVADGKMANADFTGKKVEARVYTGDVSNGKFEVEYVPYED